MKAKVLAVVILLLAVLPVSAANPYRLGGKSRASGGNSYSMKAQTGYRSTTHIANPYGVRNGDPYKYAYRRFGSHVDIVVYPDFEDRVLIQNVKEPDHWQRARLDYFQQMYGPNGVYSPKR